MWIRSCCPVDYTNIDVDEINEILSSMRDSNPKIVLEVDCFHEQQDGDGNKIKVSNKTEKRNFGYNYCADNTVDNTFHILHPYTGVKIVYCIEFADIESKQTFERFQREVKTEFEKMDEQMTVTTYIEFQRHIYKLKTIDTLEKATEQFLAVKLDSCYLNPLFKGCLGLTALFPFSELVLEKCVRVDKVFHIEKKIYAGESHGRFESMNVV